MLNLRYLIGEYKTYLSFGLGWVSRRGSWLNFGMGAGVRVRFQYRGMVRVFERGSGSRSGFSTRVRLKFWEDPTLSSTLTLKPNLTFIPKPNPTPTLTPKPNQNYPCPEFIILKLNLDLCFKT